MLIWLYRPIYLLNVHFSSLDMLTPFTACQSKGRATQASLRTSPENVKDLHDQGRVYDHMWGECMVRPDVYPGVACAQRQKRLEHAWAEVGQEQEDDREHRIARRREHRPAIEEV
jgi:hypothetical protein